ncbi:MAG: FKBP-type peptidyl-prolyl cis-trans isomerase, partial [Microbacterium sp.]
GDGYEVQAGDYVLMQYSGVRWSNGEVFDQTWGKSPYTDATTKFVPGFQKALEGHKVGSQVLVVIPPVDGYGEGEINETDLKGETLVFVVDILGAQHVEAE